MTKPASKKYVDNIFKIDIDLKDVKLENTKFVKVNYQTADNQHLNPKIYVDIALDESSSTRNFQDNAFKNNFQEIFKNNLTNINSIALNKQAEKDNEVITKAYVDQIQQENENREEIQD